MLLVNRDKSVLDVYIILMSTLFLPRLAGSIPGRSQKIIFLCSFVL